MKSIASASPTIIPMRNDFFKIFSFTSLICASILFPAQINEIKYPTIHPQNNKYPGIKIIPIVVNRYSQKNSSHLMRNTPIISVVK